MTDAVWISVAIILAAFIIAKAIDHGFDRMTRERYAPELIEAELKRIGDKLDNLWSPLKGINTAMWDGKNTDYE